MPIAVPSHRCGCVSGPLLHERTVRRPEPEPSAIPSTPESGTAAPHVLAARERSVLEFEEERWRNPGEKEEAIRVRFGISATAYYQVLNALLDDPAALTYRPALVNRLRRLRDARRRDRA